MGWERIVLSSKATKRWKLLLLGAVPRRRWGLLPALPPPLAVAGEAAEAWNIMRYNASQRNGITPKALSHYFNRATTVSNITLEILRKKKFPSKYLTILGEII